MPHNDWPRDVERIFAELQKQIEQLAQTTAGTEAALSSKDLTSDEKARSTFEYELSYESRMWDQVVEEIARRKERIDALLAEQVQKREKRSRE